MQLSKYISLVFGVLPATVGLLFQLVILFIALPVLRFSTEQIEHYQVVFGVLWIVAAIWGYIELCRVSFSKSIYPALSSLGLVLGILSIVFVHEAFKIIFNEQNVRTDSPLINLFNPSLKLVEAWLIACPTLVALYHIAKGNAAIWRLA